MNSEKLYNYLPHLDYMDIFYDSRKTCYIGFMTSIKTYQTLIPELLTVQPYVLGYKLNQDHLEHFFNAVRKAGEFTIFYKQNSCKQ